MHRFLLVLLLAASPDTSARTFARTVVDFGPAREVAAPASFVTLSQATPSGEREFDLLAVRASDGGLTIVADSLYRGPTLQGTELQKRWRRASLGCGTACFSTWYLDSETGRISSPIPTPIYEDEDDGWVLAVGGAGLVLLDPFDPAWAWTLAIREASSLWEPVVNLLANVTVDDSLLVVSADGSGETLRARIPTRATPLFGDRTFDCPPPPYPGVDGVIVYRITFAPDGSFVRAGTSRPRGLFHQAAQSVIRQCRAEPLPPDALQVDQTTEATFRFETP